jgi:hypothetical protein
MIYDVELSNGCGDHVSMILEADSEKGAKRIALAHLKTLDREDQWCALNGDEPCDVRIKLISYFGQPVMKVMAFNHEQGGYGW